MCDSNRQMAVYLCAQRLTRMRVAGAGAALRQMAAYLAHNGFVARELLSGVFTRAVPACAERLPDRYPIHPPT